MPHEGYECLRSADSRLRLATSGRARELARKQEDALAEWQVALAGDSLADFAIYLHAPCLALGGCRSASADTFAPSASANVGPSLERAYLSSFKKRDVMRMCATFSHCAHAAIIAAQVFFPISVAMTLAC